MIRRILWFCVLLAGPFQVVAGDRLMTAEDMWKAKRVGSPSVSPDGKWAAVDVTTYNIEKDDSTSEIWLLSTDGKTQKQLTSSGGKNGGPKWSPDGKWVAFVSKRTGDDVAQIYAISPNGGEARRLSAMPMAPGSLKWSGDSKTVFAIAWTYPGVDDDATFLAREKATKESKAKAVVIDDATYRYWDTWLTDGKRPTVFAVDFAGGKHRNLLAKTGKHLIPTQPGEGDYDVSPDGTELCFVADSVKDYGTDFNSDLFTIPIDGSGELKNLTTDNDANDTHPAYSPDGKSIAFLRTKIKFFYADRQRLMVRNRETGKSQDWTDGFDRTATRPKWLPDSKRIAIEVEDAGLVNIYFCSESAKPKTFPTGLSERGIDFARVGRLGVFQQSSFDLPPRLASHGPGGNPIVLEHFNDDLVKSWKLGKFESRTFKGADDKDVQMWVVYPPDFDPKKKWPLIQFVHGGPHNGIMNEFSFRWNLQLWAAQGYVVGCVNFHGSSGFGQAFTDSITGDLSNKPFTDIMKSTDWFVAQPWIDADRLATAGGSYGGYMMAWMNGHTDRFKTMVCHAGVYDWHAMLSSDIVKGRDRSLGAPPWGDLTKVDKQSAQRYAANFKTPTLVLHGEKDYRVPIAQGMAYYNTLRQKGVPTRFVYFPDENHWILKPQNALLWHKEVFGWIKKYVPPGANEIRGSSMRIVECGMRNESEFSAFDNPEVSAAARDERHADPVAEFLAAERRADRFLGHLFVVVRADDPFEEDFGIALHNVEPAQVGDRMLRQHVGHGDPIRAGSGSDNFRFGRAICQRAFE
jgi:dipeptidyl aminopeptidase/acylaminoacyl peptidase